MSKTVRIAIPSDGHGYFARECPVCNGFFKVTPGTGLTTGTDPYCPYCTHQGAGDTFWTAEQIEYARSMILNRVTGQFLQVVPPEGSPASSGHTGTDTVRDTVGPGSVRLHIEPACQADVTCTQCTLRYAVYGPYRCCPDCGRRETPDIACANLAAAVRLLATSDAGDPVRQRAATDWARAALAALEPFRSRTVDAVGGDAWAALPRDASGPSGGDAAADANPTLYALLLQTAAALAPIVGLTTS